MAYKILSIGNFGHGWDGSICDEEHIASALEELGHEVHRCQRENLGMTTFSSNRPYDFVLIAQWDGFTQQQLDYIIERPLVYWAFDYQNDGQGWHEDLIKTADLYLSKRIADSKYPNWQYLSQDFAPKFLQPYNKPIEKDIEVLFTGSYLPWATERNETIKLVNENFNLEVYSVNDWPFLERKEPRMDYDLPELYARAKVILSIDHTLEAGYWSDRNAQIMACGRRPVFRYVPLSEVRFGSEVDYFYSPEDCLIKIQEQLDYEYTRYDSTPYFYVQNHLSVKRRVQDLLTIVKGIL